MRIRLLFILLILFTFSCHKSVSNETAIYSNDFETSNLTNISNGSITRFNNSNVLGQYNNGYFLLTLSGLPAHSLVSVSFDLYIHDSWDGNKTAPDGPDIWQMIVDGNTYINTTFSNEICIPGNFCSPQSYPLNYPNNNNNPRAGAYRTDLPGACMNISQPDGTTQYKIVKTFTHTNKTLTLQCVDKLVQTNTQTPKCDESWSVDNIQIKTIAL